MNAKNMLGLGLVVTVGTVMILAHDRNSVDIAFVGVLLAYVAGQLISEPVLQCEDCHESLIDHGERDTTDIPGRKTGLPSLGELRNALKGRRQNGEHKPTNP